MSEELTNNEGTNNNEAQTVSPKELTDRLKNWVSERPLLTRFFEYKARDMIARAAIQDLQTPNSYSAQQILEATQMARTKIAEIVNTRGGADHVLSFERRDSVTKEPFQTRFRREVSGALVAEEVRVGENGTQDVISQARITADGRTDLTLNFKGPRFEGDPKRSRNPQIIVDKRFPRATVATFNLLAGTIK